MGEDSRAVAFDILVRTGLELVRVRPLEVSFLTIRPTRSVPRYIAVVSWTRIGPALRGARQKDGPRLAGRAMSDRPHRQTSNAAVGMSA
jgi:hypothetical protein